MKTGYELLVSLDWQTIIIQLSGGRKAGGAEHEEGVRGQSLEGQ